MSSNPGSLVVVMYSFADCVVHFTPERVKVNELETQLQFRVSVNGIGKFRNWPTNRLYYPSTTKARKFRAAFNENREPVI